VAVEGCRVPRGLRKSGIAENTSMSGRGCAIIRLHLWRGLWLRCGMPGKPSLTSNTTLYLLLESVMQSLLRKLNGPVYSAEIEEKMQRFLGWLSEKDRRRYAAIEAAKLGHGGVEYIARVLAGGPKTIL